MAINQSFENYRETFLPPPNGSPGRFNAFPSLPSVSDRPEPAYTFQDLIPRTNPCSGLQNWELKNKNKTGTAFISQSESSPFLLDADTPA